MIWILFDIFWAMPIKDLTCFKFLCDMWFFEWDSMLRPEHVGPWFYLGYMSKHAFSIPCETCSNRVWTQHFENTENRASKKRKPGFLEEVMFELDPEGMFILQAWIARAFLVKEIISAKIQGVQGNVKSQVGWRRNQKLNE